VGGLGCLVGFFFFVVLRGLVFGSFFFFFFFFFFFVLGLSQIGKQSSPYLSPSSNSMRGISLALLFFGFLPGNIGP